MSNASKQRPSARRGATAAGVKVARGTPRIYRNSYTRAGRRLFTRGWVVKLQHRGRRRTFSLRAKAKTAAATEAAQIRDALVTEGWRLALRRYPSPRKIGDCASKKDSQYSA